MRTCDCCEASRTRWATPRPLSRKPASSAEMRSTSRSDIEVELHAEARRGGALVGDLRRDGVLEGDAIGLEERDFVARGAAGLLPGEYFAELRYDMIPSDAAFLDRNENVA